MTSIKRILYLFAIIALLAMPLYATDWYVRPDGAGTKDGTSYANAWESFDNVVWDGEGVVAGDTLYVCGTHIYGTHYTDTYGLNITVSGTSENYITIRGDYGGDPGLIWNGRQLTGGWTDNEDGSFYQNINYNAAFVAEGDAGSEVLLRNKDNQGEVAATDGSVWVNTEPTPDVIWYNPTGDTPKTLWYNWVYSAIDLNGNSYFVIRDLTLRGAAGSRGNIILRRLNDEVVPSYITIQDCDCAFAQYTLIYADQETNHITIDNCTFHDAPTALYLIHHDHDYITIKNCEAYSGNDTEGIFSATSSDRHVFASQGGDNWLVENNYIHDWAGDGIFLYLATDATYQDATIRYNIIINLNDDNDSYYHRGIFWGGSNVNAGLPNSISGTKIYYNIIANCGGDVGDDEGIAIRAKSGNSEMSDIPEVFNNVIYDCNFGLYCAHDGTNNSVAVEYKNNIVLSPKAGGYHTAFEAATGDTTGVTYNYNSYYPDTSDGDNQFQWRGVLCDDFADWKSDSSQDANSINTDSKMTDPGGSDFTLQVDSPCINRGTFVGLILDYLGLPVPIGHRPDIGAYEHKNGGAVIH